MYYSHLLNIFFSSSSVGIVVLTSDMKVLTSDIAVAPVFSEIVVGLGSTSLSSDVGVETTVPLVMVTLFVQLLLLLHLKYQ